MGYRSQVAIVIEFSTSEQADNYLSTNLRKYSPKDEHNYFVQQVIQSGTDGKFLLFQDDWVKWYDDYEDVQEMTKFYLNSVDAEGFVGYAFNRLGESSDDYEEDCAGEHAWEYIGMVRKLEINVGGAE